MEPNKKILIAGVGNYLMGDEGIGIHVALQLEKEQMPDNITVLDGGTGGFHLLEHFEAHGTVILVDATLDDNAPGTIWLTEPRFADDFPPALSSHDIGLKDLVGSLQLLNKMPRIYLYAISINSIQQQGVELTPEVARAVPRIIASVKRLVQNLQAQTLPRMGNARPVKSPLF